jgi:ribulose-5-phosphate 4-epimerase/fuculose-1-phosphate aldolase
VTILFASGQDGRATGPGQPKSSAETLLHVVAAERPGVGAVLHTHSVWGTLLSDWFRGRVAFPSKAMRCSRDWMVNSDP